MFIILKTKLQRIANKLKTKVRWLSSPAFQLNFISTLVRFHFFIATRTALCHTSCSPLANTVHPGHHATQTHPGPPCSFEQLKFIPQCGCTVIHSDCPLLMSNFSFFAITNNTTLNSLLLLSLHIACWEFINRINFKPRAKGPVHLHVQQPMLNYPTKRLCLLPLLPQKCYFPSPRDRQPLAR